MPTALTEADLLAIISSAELDDIAKTSIAVTPGSNPIEEAIEAATAEIALYVNPLTLTDEAFRAIGRVLTVCSLYNRLTILPEKWKDERSHARRMLEGIRDGKFPNLVVDKSLVPEAEETTDGQESSIGGFGSSSAASGWRPFGGLPT